MQRMKWNSPCFDRTAKRSSSRLHGILSLPIIFFFLSTYLSCAAPNRAERFSLISMRTIHGDVFFSSFFSFLSIFHSKRNILPFSRWLNDFIFIWIDFFCDLALSKCTFASRKDNGSIISFVMIFWFFFFLHIENRQLNSIEGKYVLLLRMCNPMLRRSTGESLSL